MGNTLKNNWKHYIWEHVNFFQKQTLQSEEIQHWKQTEDPAKQVPKTQQDSNLTIADSCKYS